MRQVWKYDIHGKARGGDGPHMWNAGARALGIVRERPGLRWGQHAGQIRAGSGDGKHFLSGQTPLGLSGLAQIPDFGQGWVDMDPARVDPRGQLEPTNQYAPEVPSGSCLISYVT